MAVFRRSAPPEPRGRRTYNRAPVTTYYRSKRPADDRSPFLKKPAKKSHRKYLVGAADILLLVALLAAIIYSLMLNSQPDVSATSTTYHTAGYYQVGVDKAFGGLKNRTKVSFDEAAAVSHIRRQFPEVRAVQIELPFFSQRAKVKLIISPPAFKLASGQSTYLVDSDGVAVSTVSAGFGQLPTVIDQSGFTVPNGRQVLSSSSVDFIVNLLRQTSHAKVPLKSLTLPDLPQELDLRTTDQPYYVKFNLDGDPAVQAGQWLAARHEFAKNHIKPSSYLDVRVSGRIFYK